MGLVHIASGIGNTFSDYSYLSNRPEVQQVATGFHSDPSGMYVSLYAVQRIVTNEVDVFSDARMKNISGVSNGEEDLKTLLNLEITDYSFKDPIKNGSTPQKKVVAQQVAEVYPQAVSKRTTEVVPDVMRLGTIAGGQVSLANHGLKASEKVQIKFEDNSEQVFQIHSVDSDSFMIDAARSGKAFVYGRQVTDFHTVDIEALSMLNISATQQLHKMIANLESENARLRDTVEKLSQTNTTLTVDLAEQTAQSRNEVTEIRLQLSELQRQIQGR